MGSMMQDEIIALIQNKTRACVMMIQYNRVFMCVTHGGLITWVAIAAGNGLVSYVDLSLTKLRGVHFKSKKKTKINSKFKYIP